MGNKWINGFYVPNLIMPTPNPPIWYPYSKSIRHIWHELGSGQWFKIQSSWYW